VRKTIAVLASAAALAGPTAPLLAVAVLSNPAATSSCLAGAGLRVTGVPDTLEVETTDGKTTTLNRTQLTRAATITAVGSRVEGTDRDAIVIALMAALTESSLRMLSNTKAYPESGAYPNDGDASDHDSLGLFQMRHSTGWGTVEELMDPAYQTRAFMGGPTGPNHPSPRGLLDIPGWKTLPKGAAAQAVEVSAYPDRYAKWETAANQILAALTKPAPKPGGGSPEVPETAGVVFPLPEGSWTLASRFGYRIHPITGRRRLHAGTDYAAADGTPILAVADGTVTFAGPSSGYGNLILISHTVAGQAVTSGYAHMWDGHTHVRTGDEVAAGQRIADVGSSGASTGPHLHFEIRPGGGSPTDSHVWLTGHGAKTLDAPALDPAGCATGARP
jgi:murein DD-endopeptidase MepM/ murein hydrolase activator NlpD